MISGMPARTRFQPPPIFSASILTWVSACSSTWCEKYTESSPSSLNSATGTWLPLIWQVDRLNLILAMSLIGGCGTQPDLVALSRISTGAPQLPHEVAVPSLCIRQYGHV